MPASVRYRSRPDPILLGLTLVLLVAGLLVLESASYPHALNAKDAAFYFVERQAMYVLLGLALMFVAIHVDLDLVRRLSPGLYVLSIIALLAVRSPLGRVHGGARRWLDLGIIDFQPSEFAKVALILLLAHVLAKCGPEIRRSQRLLWFVVAIALGPIVFVFVQPHLSATLVLMMITAVMLYAAGVRMSHLLKLCAVTTAVGTLAFAVMVLTGVLPRDALTRHQYQVQRIVAFFTGEDPLDSDYQQIQSVRGFQRGGLWGIGYCRGIQKHRWLPAAHTDFIFSVIGEELGLWGSCLTILLFGAVGLRGFHIAHQCTDPFRSLVCVGLTSLIIGEAALNMAVATRSLPATGVPLPLFSYGGSFMVFTLISIGLMLNTSRALRPLRQV